jgi:hypothetical protein
MQVGVLFGDNDELGMGMTTPSLAQNFFKSAPPLNTQVAAQVHDSLNVLNQIPVIDGLVKTGRAMVREVQGGGIINSKPINTDGLPGDMGVPQKSGVPIFLIGAVVIGALVLGSRK